MKSSINPVTPEFDTQQARQRAIGALRLLSVAKPAAEVNYGEIGAQAKLPWQTVKRLLGPREDFAALLDGGAPEPIDTRDRILDAAARIFAQKSYQGASLDEVAADAGLTKGAVYWHFKSKSDLFFALLDSRFQQEHDEHLPEALARESAHVDPKEGLKSVLAGVLDRVKQDPDWPRLFLEFMGQARDPEVRQRLASAYQDAWRMSANLISHQHQLRGQTPPADPELLAIFWSALIDGLIISWLVNPDRIKLDSLMPRIVDMLWQGLQPTSSSTE